MNDMEKLRILIPHWIEHNQEHASEFENWADKVGLAGHQSTAQGIRHAAQVMQEVNAALGSALDDLGGAIHQDSDHHHHHAH